MLLPESAGNANGRVRMIPRKKETKLQRTIARAAVDGLAVRRKMLACLKNLAKVGDTKAVKVVRMCLKDEDIELKVMAAETLAVLAHAGDADTIDDLRKVIHTKDGAESAVLRFAVGTTLSKLSHKKSERKVRA